MKRELLAWKINEVFNETMDEHFQNPIFTRDTVMTNDWNKCSVSTVLVKVPQFRQKKLPKRRRYFLCLLVLFADNLCKQFGPTSGPT